MSRRLAGFTVLLVTCLITAPAAQNRRSPVADAAQAGDRPAIQKLLQAKADVNAP